MGIDCVGATELDSLYTPYYVLSFEPSKGSVPIEQKGQLKLKNKGPTVAY